MDEHEISPEHPRATSLKIRSKLVQGFLKGITSTFGLFAHGRGEAFDYLIGEVTTTNAQNAIRVAAASFLLSRHPVISVNGNVAALVPHDLVRLAEVTGAKLEVNLYHRSKERETAIAQVLRDAGASEIYGLDSKFHRTIPEIHSDRRIVDQRGLFTADLAFVPLEDGDRTEGLVKQGKKVITIDLNPLSRTAQMATISIIDNIVRALPLLVLTLDQLQSKTHTELEQIQNEFDNHHNLSEAIRIINERLNMLAATQGLSNEGGTDR
ncbi:MAG: phosphopantothenate/pantothenate synthetase [Candidatus Hodarchaeota archaeon]